MILTVDTDFFFFGGGWLYSFHEIPLSAKLSIVEVDVLCETLVLIKKCTFC